MATESFARDLADQYGGGHAMEPTLVAPGNPFRADPFTRQGLRPIPLAKDKFDTEVLVPTLSPAAQELVARGAFREPEFFLKNLQTGKKIELVHKQTMIGRNPNLPVHVNDISVSSKHARIDANENFTKCFLQDLGTLNGCFINGQKVPADSKKRL